MWLRPGNRRGVLAGFHRESARNGPGVQQLAEMLQKTLVLACLKYIRSDDQVDLASNGKVIRGQGQRARRSSCAFKALAICA